MTFRDKLYKIFSEYAEDTLADSFTVTLIGQDADRVMNDIIELIKADLIGEHVVTPKEQGSLGDNLYSNYLDGQNKLRKEQNSKLEE